jgi:CP family cyanate transporter-like MFS transporter
MDQQVAAKPGGAGATTGWVHMALIAAMLWLCGAALRLTVLAIPPLIPAIHRDIGLGETGIGVLSSLPSLMFAWAAILGSLLVARFGMLRTLIFGLLLAAAASALRGAAGAPFFLYATTVVMSLGLSVMQPALPPIVRAWMPKRIGLGTSIYSNGWLVGEILAVWLTIPLVLPLSGGSWRWSLVTWSVPLLATALLVIAFAPRPHRSERPSMALRHWWPDWRQWSLWRMGLIMGGANVAYWGSNAFIPDFLTHIGRPELIGDTLTALNVGQLPVSLLLLVAAGYMAGRAWPLIAMGGCMLVGLVGMVIGGEPIWIELGAALIGFACAGTLILQLTVPPLIYPAEDVARTTAGMFVVGYSCSVVVPIIGGALWDATHSPYPVFALIAASAVASLVLPRSVISRSAPEPD